MRRSTSSRAGGEVDAFAPIKVRDVVALCCEMPKDDGLCLNGIRLFSCISDACKLLRQHQYGLTLVLYTSLTEFICFRMPCCDS